MYYKNEKKDCKSIINTATIGKPTINSRTFTSIFIAITLSSMVTGALLSISIIQRVNAQMSNGSISMGGSMMGGIKNGTGSNMSIGSNMGSNMMAIPAKAPQLNITTAAPPISPSMFKSMAPQMHVDLINATMIAQNWVGSSSHAVSSMIGIQNGSPVYTIWVIDSNSGLHQIVVDPLNGKVVFANQPMSMSGPFS